VRLYRFKAKVMGVRFVLRRLMDCLLCVLSALG